MTKYHVSNALWRIVDRVSQVYGALSHKAGQPFEAMTLYARMARLGDGPDEVYIQKIATNLIRAWEEDGEIASKTGNLLTAE